MTNKRENIPNAATLIQSMRSIGYDFESAVADIIDNAITASAKKIDIIFPSSNHNDITLCIIDNGDGMEKNELIEAMRFGSIKPQNRSSTDLGRFGLGLKTASISQCKRLTVISKKNNSVNAFCWDLDQLSIENSWEMIELSTEEINQLIFPYEELLMKERSFTLVLWEKFDTINKDVTLLENSYDVFLKKISHMEKHLSLIFHRFIEQGLEININSNRINSFDPFLSKHPKTLIKPEQIISTKTKDNKHERVLMQVYILPYFKDLGKIDYEKLGGYETLNNQGFYIYRNKRLMFFGTWFKINPKAELSRNARIRIDIPNTLDDLWSIDIKKQKAIIPSSLLMQLRKEVEDAVTKSKRIYDYKGQIQTQEGSIWRKKVNLRNNSVHYEINREADFIKNLKDDLDEKSNRIIEKLLNIVELSLPYKDIYNSVADKKEINNIDCEKQDELLLTAYDMFQKMRNRLSYPTEQIIELICQREPFLSAKIQDKLRGKINE